MTYHPEEYQVTKVNLENGAIRSFDVNIKGANFTIYRHHNNFQPTNTFKFNYKIRFVGKYDDNGKLIGGRNVEIDWDTCTRGLLHLAEQMGELTGNKFILKQGFTGTCYMSQFKEVAA